jgi:hypothetical protein
MRSDLPSALTSVPIAAAVACAALGCTMPLPVYQQPSPTEPHALVKLRGVYHSVPSRHVKQKVQLNDTEVPLPQSGEMIALLVRPVPTTWVHSMWFYHLETHMQTSSHSYSCGTGTCTSSSSQPVTVPVYDASCGAVVAHLPRAGSVYLLQYDFFGHAQCSLQCLEQVPQPDGSFQTKACEGIPAPPPTVAR